MNIRKNIATIYNLGQCWKVREVMPQMSEVKAVIELCHAMLKQECDDVERETIEAIILQYGVIESATRKYWEIDANIKTFEAANGI